MACSLLEPVCLSRDQRVTSNCTLLEIQCVAALGTPRLSHRTGGSQGPAREWGEREKSGRGGKSNWDCNRYIGIGAANSDTSEHLAVMFTGGARRRLEWDGAWG